jgi:3-oxoacyl-[acyl-carrier-protein] synthase-3
MSRYWHLATIAGGGSAHPRGDEHSYFQSDGMAMRDAFAEMGAHPIERALEQSGTSFDDYSCILVHQVAMPYLRNFLAATGVPEDKVQLTLPDFGNIASATLPAGFVVAERAGRIAPGDNVLWIGLASGISAGVIAMQY